MIIPTIVAKFITNVKPIVNCKKTKSTVKGATPIVLLYENKSITPASIWPIKLPATDPITRNTMIIIAFEFLLAMLLFTLSNIVIN